MKKMLYIGHNYHNKTKSTEFLIELFKEKYIVEEADHTIYSNDISIQKNLKNKHYDVIVLFQILPPRLILKDISFESGIFFPMYDGGPNHEDPIWQDYQDFLIINFSWKMHEELLNKGMNSRYIQYFPKPENINSWGQEDSAFFWNRVESININTVALLLGSMKIRHLHMHNALDPLCQKKGLKTKWDVEIEESGWVDDKQKLLPFIEAASLYIAPRPYEGIGMGFLEAMALGRCVIAANNPTMNEYIENGKTGILYDLNELKPLVWSDTRQIQKNAYAFIQKGYEQWEKEKWNILTWVEHPLECKKNLLFDATVLIDGFLHGGASKTGIYFTAYNIFSELLKNSNFNTIIYCEEVKIAAAREFLRHYFSEYKIPVFSQKSELSCINVFFSPVFKVPEHIKDKNWIYKFIIFYDILPLSHPEYFKDNFTPWFFEMLNSINKEDSYFCISQYTAQEFLKYVPKLCPQQLTVTPLAASPSFRASKKHFLPNKIRQKYHIPLNIPYCFSLCSLEPRKNLIMTIKAFLEFKKRHPEEPLIYVLGGAAWKNFINSVKSEIPEFQNNSIILTGYMDDDDLPSLYNGAEFFIYTSRDEGFGLPPLEAMQCGTPVIASNTTSLPEVVGDSAISISPDSLEEHIQAYERIHFHKRTRSYYRKKGLKRAQFFTWDKTVQIITNKILETLNHPLPKITIITVTHNLILNKRVDTFLKCLQSVHSQCYPGKIEHIVIDGASDDGTISLLAEYQKKGWITFHSEKDSGIYDAMNKGIAYATGQYIIFLNSDDNYATPYAIQCCVESLYRTNADYCYGNAIFISNNNQQVVWKGSLDTLPFGTHYCHQTMLVELELLRNWKGFDISYEASADSDLMVRLFAFDKKSVYVNMNLVCYRAGGFADRHQEQCIVDHARAFYHWIGKKWNCSFQDCLKLRKGTYLELSYPQLVNLVSKIKYVGWVKEIFIRYNSAHNFSKSFQTIQIKHPYSFAWKFSKYRILSHVLMGRRRKHYQQKYQKIKQDLSEASHIEYRVFGVPLAKAVKFSNIYFYYLFGLIPVMTITKSSHSSKLILFGLEVFKKKKR